MLPIKLVTSKVMGYRELFTALVVPTMLTTCPLPNSVTGGVVKLTTNWKLLVLAPSPTSKVMVSDPATVPRGDNWIVRVSAVPARTMLPLGTMAGFCDVAVTVRLLAGIPSGLETVKEIGAVGLPAGEL